MRESKTIVITGVSRGLGRAMVDKFIELGHRVIGCARSEAAVDKLSQQYGEPHDFASVDVRNDSQVSQWAARAIKQHGAPDLLLNNAATINRNARLWEIGAEEFGKIVDINIKGVQHVLRHFVPAMIARGHGVIVNFSSTWGRSVSPEVAPYCATKWAIEGLTQALAKELPRNLAAVPLNPGIICTDMLRSCFGDHASAYPGPAAWAESAVPFLLNLGPKDNGQPLTVP